MQVFLYITFLTELCLIKAIVYKFVVTNFFGFCEIFFGLLILSFRGWYLNRPAGRMWGKIVMNVTTFLHSEIKDKRGIAFSHQEENVETRKRFKHLIC